MKKIILVSIAAMLVSCYAGGTKNFSLSTTEISEAQEQSRKADKVKAIWIRETDLKKGTDFYLEAAQDGSILSREENNGTIFSRKGTIPARFAKDLIRETERSDAMSAHAKSSSDVFASGNLKVYAYISGELTIVELPVSDFGRNFTHALTELTGEVSKMPITQDLAGILYCDAISEDDLPAVNKKIAIEGEIEIIETAKIRTFPPLMAAIIDQGRMIPLETRDSIRELSEFINKYDLYGSRAEFIIPSTRGTFACYMKNTYRDGSQKPLTAEEKYESY